jgi:hypothetical protein
MDNDTPVMCSSCGTRPAGTVSDSTGAPYCNGCAAWIWSNRPHPDDTND